jgi:hypothetical protein
MATIAVTYLSGSDFDMDYYVTKHMPLVAKYVLHRILKPPYHPSTANMRHPSI